MEKAIEECLCEYWRSFCNLPGSEVIEKDGLTLCYTGVNFSTFNGVFCADLRGGGAERKIDECTEYFKSRKVPMLWRVGPFSRPGGLSNMLKKKGYSVYADEMGMAIELDTVLWPSAPSGLNIVEVKNEKDLKLFVDVLAQVFELPDNIVSDAIYSSYLEHMKQGTGKFTHYLAFVGDKPVSTASLMMSDQYPGIYNGCTVESERGKGISSVLLYKSMELAREKGHKICYLQSSPMSRGLCLKAGFKPYGLIQYMEMCP